LRGGLTDPNDSHEKKEKEMKEGDVPFVEGFMEGTV
jgi:hypothetical protein